MNQQRKYQGKAKRGDLRSLTGRFAAGVAIGLLMLILTPAAALASICGDCDGNGRITILDALVAAQHASGVITITGPRLLSCDADASGAVDILDALAIAAEAAGLPPRPVVPNLRRLRRQRNPRHGGRSRRLAGARDLVGHHLRAGLLQRRRRRPDRLR